MEHTQSLRSRLFADRSFYAMVLAIAVPIMLQSAVTNFVNLLDNIMIGRLGTLEMSGVSIANQLLFIYNISIFGCVNAAGIFSAQYCGKKDHDGVRNCLRLKTVVGMAAALIASVIAVIALLLMFGADTDSLFASRSVIYLVIADIIFAAYVVSVSIFGRDEDATQLSVSQMIPVVPFRMSKQMMTHTGPVIQQMVCITTNS